MKEFVWVEYAPECESGKRRKGFKTEMERELGGKWNKAKEIGLEKGEGPAEAFSSMSD